MARGALSELCVLVVLGRLRPVFRIAKGTERSVHLAYVPRAQFRLSPWRRTTGRCGSRSDGQGSDAGAVCPGGFGPFAASIQNRQGDGALRPLGVCSKGSIQAVPLAQDYDATFAACAARERGYAAPPSEPRAEKGEALRERAGIPTARGRCGEHSRPAD